MLDFLFGAALGVPFGFCLCIVTWLGGQRSAHKLPEAQPVEHVSRHSSRTAAAIRNAEI